MADKVAIDLLINAAESAKSVKDLKQSMKDLKNAALEVGEGSKDFVRLAGAASEAKQRMDDLNDAVRALDSGDLGQNISRIGSTIAGGFQAAQGAMALFGAESEDVEKALLKVQAATALAQGIQSVSDLGKSFVALRNILNSTAIGQKIVTAAQWLWNAAVNANPIMLMVTALGAAITAMALFGTGAESAAEKQERLNDELEKTNERLKGQVDLYSDLNKNTRLTIQNQINLLKAKGATDKEIYEKERELIQNSLNELAYRKGFIGKLTAEEIREERALLNAKEVLQLNYEKRQSDKQIADQKKSQDEYLKGQEKLDQLKKAAREKESTLEFERKEFEKSEAEREALEFDAQMMRRFEANVEYIDKTKDYELEREFATEQEKFAIAQQSVNSLQSLSDLFFEAKLATLQKGTAAEDRAARNQFKINKALALQSNIISTIMGITNALSAQSIVPEPFGTILKAATAVSVGIAGTANTIKIAKSQYGGGASSVSAPSLSAPSVNASRGVNINPVRSTTSTTIDSEKVEAGQSVVRAYVVESDVTSKQNSIKNIEQKSKI